jgi:endonuclease YncB( thermonuclease family)
MRTDNKCEKDEATKSRDFVSSLLKSAKRIDLVNIDRDKYFRILAEVEVDGASLSKALLERGFAYAYQGGTKKSVDWCTNKTPHSVGH